jgi:hypothetical protein
MGAVTEVLFPEVGLIRSSSGARRRLVVWILGATAVFSIAVAIAVFMLLSHESKLARHGAQHFAAALVAGDPQAAPDGGAAYVAGVRAHFGAVTATQLLGTHNKGINTGDEADTRSYYVADLWIETKRGPAVLAIEFDNGSLNSEAISDVHEIHPQDAPGLTAAQHSALLKGYDARGGEPAQSAELADAAVTASVPVAPVPVATPSPVAPVHVAKPPAVHIHIPARLRCVQRAHGDVSKIARC